LFYYQTTKTFAHYTKPKPNLYYTRRFTPKRLTSWRCPIAHLRVIAPRQNSYLGRCWSGGEPFATLCKIWSAYGKRTLDLHHTRHAC